MGDDVATGSSVSDQSLTAAPINPKQLLMILRLLRVMSANEPVDQSVPWSIAQSLHTLVTDLLWSRSELVLIQSEHAFFGGFLHLMKKSILLTHFPSALLLICAACRFSLDMQASRPAPIIPVIPITRNHDAPKPPYRPAARFHHHRGRHSINRAASWRSSRSPSACPSQDDNAAISCCQSQKLFRSIFNQTISTVVWNKRLVFRAQINSS